MLCIFREKRTVGESYCRGGRRLARVLMMGFPGLKGYEQRLCGLDCTLSSKRAVNERQLAVAAAADQPEEVMTV